MKLIFQTYLQKLKKYEKLENKDFAYNDSFNPNKVKTNREKYVLLNQLKIYESIYIKI